MRIPELRDTCKELKLPFSGIKGDLIQRVIHFLKTGIIVNPEPIPDVSKARKGIDYPLLPETRILYGNYRNDFATRVFMKTLVGNHFHFTASGIDWIKERWRAGNPPSYREFADFWQQQYLANKQKRPPPKEEWAFIKFTQAYLTKKPAASHEELIGAWKQEQRYQVRKAQQIIQSCLSKLS